jgi:prepilin-type N-terminal cleavage/methylation domain-containing protein
MELPCPMWKIQLTNHQNRSRFSPPSPFASLKIRKPTTMKPRSGFTLVELLIVIAIIAVLAVLVTAFARSSIATSRSASALNNIRQIGMANIQLYSQDHNGAINGYGEFVHPGTGAKKQKTPWRTAYLLSTKAEIRWSDVVEIIGNLKDPTIPDNLSWSPHFPLAINSEFNMARDENGNWMAPSPTSGPRLASYENPGSMIYAVGGHELFTPEMADNPAYKEMPASIRQGPYFSHKGKTPAIFLDGHADMLRFPIDRKLLTVSP